MDILLTTPSVIQSFANLVNSYWLPPDMREMNTMVNDLRRALGIK